MKRDEVTALLALVEKETNEMLEDEAMVYHLTPQEIVMIAMESIMNTQFHRPVFTAPIGKVDRDKVEFVISESLGMNIMLAGEEEEYEEE